MTPPGLRLVYMGTPDFAVPALEALAAGPHRVLQVVTQPDKPRGRGRRLESPPVKRAAERLGLPVVQPATIRDERFLRILQALFPDALVVAAFGQFLPQPLLDLAPLGALNLHASLLPRYRGAAPIQWALRNRETRTGVTLMRMARGMDSGDILALRDMPIEPDDTAASLGRRLAHLAAALLLEALPRWAAGQITPQPQDPREATYAPLLRKADGRVDWRRPALEIEAFVRAMSPWPGAFTHHGDSRLILHRVAPAPAAGEAPPGTVLEGMAGAPLRIATGEGALLLLEIQGPSGKRLECGTFLRGHPLPPGTLLH
jgi:methionyl-tRNA formyltransferase